MRASEVDRPDVQTLRTNWPHLIAEIPIRSLVFLDESSASTSLARLYGRSPVGQRLRDSAPAGHWLTVTMLSAIRIDGPVAPLLVDGPIDGAMFTAWLEQSLLRELRPGDVIIMDNLSSHKVSGVSAALRSAGYGLLYLPPYSHDLNPIENMWAKIKSILRGLKARTFNELMNTVKTAFGRITQKDCAGFFKHCGYRSNFI